MKQMKQKQNLTESGTADLHESIIINILIFLPIQCIIRCRCVCKTWATLISQPCFIKLYDSTKKPGPVQLLIEDRLNSMAPNNLFWAQIDEAASTANSPADFLVLSKLRFPLKFLDEFPNPSSYKLKVCSTCSVTGCIAASKYNAKDHVNTSSPVSCHIFNPVTGHHILVDDNENSYRWDCCALLYVEKTNQFKFLYFHGWIDNMDEVEIDIQTVGSNSWRSMGKIPFYPEQQSFPTFVNGLYHWIDPRNHVLYSFDAEEEVFQQIQTPPGTGSSVLRSYLGLMNGCLCCLCICVKTNIDLWVMSEGADGKSWTKKFVLYGLDLGIDPYDTLQPLICLENGDVVMLDPRRHAISYNPTTRSRKYIRFDERKRSLRYRAFSFIPSLRSVLPSNTT